MTDTAVEAFTSELHPHAASGPGGGQFVSTAGASGKATAKKTAKGGIPAGSMFFNRKRGRGTGYGMPGGDKRVRALQTITNRLGLTDMHGQPLAVDGKLGPKTTSVIVKLQQRLGVKADGIVTPAFLAQIRNLRAVPMRKKAGKARMAARAREAIPATAWWDIDPIGPLDEATEALIVALDVLSPNRTTEARLTGDQFNSAHKRGSDGKFIKMIDRIIGALYEHEKNGGEGGDPLAEFNRTQLRNAAKSRGITLTRGESEDSIKAKLIASIRGDNGGSDKPEPAPAKAAKKAAPRKLSAKKAAPAKANPHQDEIDRGERRRAASDVASEVEELTENQAAPDEIRARVTAAADRRKGKAGEDELRSLATQLEGVEDVEQMRQTARQFAETHGLKRIGDAGQHVTFDPALHQAVGDERLRPGDRAFVVRPGYTAKREGWSADYFGDGDAVLRKAVVEEGMTPHEEAAYNAGRPGAAATHPPTPEALDERARRDAEIAQLRSELDYVTTSRNTHGDSDPNGIGRRGRNAAAAAIRQRIADLETGTAAPAMPDDQVDARIAQAYTELGRPGEVVSLLRLRDRLPDIDRPTLDRALKRLDRARVIQLDPEPNQKALPLEARDASVRLGGDDRHLISSRQLHARPAATGPKSAPTAPAETPESRARVLRGGTWDTPAESLSTYAGERLKAATSREQAHQLISALTVAELRDLAKELGVPVKSSANKTALRNAIVQLAVGVRLDSFAINPGR